MIKMRYSLAICFLFFFTLSIAQTLVLPHEIGLKRKGKTTIENIKFLEYPCQSKEIDLREFKKRNPKLKASDYLVVELPPFVNISDLTVLIGLINGVEATEGALVIWLAENYRSDKVTFYVDKNLDRKFDGTGEKIVLRSTSKPIEVKVEPDNKRIPNQQFWLQAPPKRRKDSFNVKRQSKIMNQFAASVEIGVNIGKLRYNYDNLEIGFPTWYSVNFTKKSIGAGFSYNTKRFRIGINANYQNAYAYTSYLNVRFDEPEIIVDPVTSITRKIDNVLVQTNLDRHDTHRFQYGASIGLRIHVNRVMEIQPFIAVGQTKYSSDTYDGDRYSDSKKYDLTPSNFLKTGLRFEFLTNANQAIFLDMNFQHNEWEPKGLLDGIDYANFEVQYQDWGMGFGYRVGF